MLYLAVMKDYVILSGWKFSLSWKLFILGLVVYIDFTYSTFAGTHFYRQVTCDLYRQTYLRMYEQKVLKLRNKSMIVLAILGNQFRQIDYKFDFSSLKCNLCVDFCFKLWSCLTGLNKFIFENKLFF